ncbi:MAG: energy-coupling factor transporter ATPase [Oscillospiraceae bacterium]|jgi:energy-coupling factor transport system ATP-binding protein|nr:energy-coupling factor transporter ATPase [Ruminococcus sp.]MDD7338630.1 energy-coupling factor transporter ATPase [Ruminococcus sp.]MDY6060439.1 energy-coupling factor transporter ATPase [Oscillospiraceae bacterium]
MESVISVRNLTHSYNEGLPNKFNAIENLNFDIYKGDFVGLIGHTGSGKSTLIQHFNGLLKPTQGQILLDGKDIWSDKKSVREAKFKVGLCFQYPEYQLFEETVAKDIAFGPKNMKLPEKEIAERVAKAAMYVGLKREYMEKSPFDLSGGEKRRAAIAGVMAMQPEVLILDEPTAGLDPRGRDKILSLISNYRAQTGCTVILVSHSMEDVARVANRVMVMNKGSLAMYGTVNEVYSQFSRLNEMGLNVPQVSRVFDILSEKLPELKNSNVYTVDSGAEILARLFKERGALK